MADLRVICLSSRTASLLLCPDGARYHLPAPIRWSLWANGAQLRQGVAEIAPLFFEDLTPDRVYRLESDLGAIEFRTKPCAGQIEAVEFGASPKAADNAPALAKAIAATPQGGCLRLSPGCYASAPLFLKPGITLWLPKGAVIEALADWRADWPVLPAFDPAGRYTGSWEGLPEACFAAPITAIDCPGLILTGLGCIDGGGDRGDWWSWPKETRQGARRPRTIYIVRSRDVQLSGLTIRNSPSWTIHPLLCDGLIASALHIENPPDSPNTDGFNPESCCDLEMTGLRFSVGDDCIAVKSGKRAPGQESHLAPTRRLSISHCHMERGHGAVVLGSEMSGEITDVTIARCRFDGTDRGLRLKTRRGRGGAIARVVMEEVEMKNVAT
ncbi:MAG: glycoside hydrolase family 28 protein, partial [Mangrovicoccus sp.]